MRSGQEQNAQNVREAKLSQFGERLREAFRGAKNVHIAKVLDVSEAGARNYLDGRIPPAEMLVLISERTGCSIHWLITGDGEKFLRSIFPEDLANSVHALTKDYPFNLELFVAALAEMNSEFRAMLHDLGFKRALRVKRLVDEALELFEEEGEVMHERLMETIRAQMQAKEWTTNLKTHSTEEEQRIRESKPRSRKKKKKAEGE